MCYVLLEPIVYQVQLSHQDGQAYNMIHKFMVIKTITIKIDTEWNTLPRSFRDLYPNTVDKQNNILYIKTLKEKGVQTGRTRKRPPGAGERKYHTQSHAADKTLWTQHPHFTTKPSGAVLPAAVPY